MNQQSERKSTWSENVAFEAWRHHAAIGGADKDRMIQIATLLLGFSAAIIGFTFKEAIKNNEVVEPLAAICLSLIGMVVSVASGVMTLLYGGYANRNWAKADQIAHEAQFSRLEPTDSPFPPEAGSAKRSALVDWALRESEPRTAHVKLAPIFWWFFWLSVVAFAIHLLILVWSSVDGNWNTTAGSLPLKTTL